MKLLAALLPLLLSVAGRIIAALGITAVTYVGFDIIIQRFQNEIVSSMSGAPLALLQLFYLSGGGVVLNVFFGAMAFILSYKQFTRLATSLQKKS